MSGQETIKTKVKMIERSCQMSFQGPIKYTSIIYIYTNLRETMSLEHIQELECLHLEAEAPIDDQQY